MIHYLTPYATDGNIGRALNEACSHVPDGEWICLRDGDAMFTAPDYGRLISEVVQRHGEQYDLFGAMTNRLGWKHHLVPGMFDEWDLRRHHDVGRNLADLNGPSAVGTRELIGGFFMLFKRSVWERVRFTEDRSRARLFDGDFSRQIPRRAIIPGLYLIHLYRIWSHSPRNEVRHLTQRYEEANHQISASGTKDAGTDHLAFVRGQGMGG